MNRPTNLIRSAVALTRAAGSSGKPSRDDLALINALTSRELPADEVFVLSGIASTDAPDSYFTHMDPATSLANFARDLSNGSAFLDSHDETRLPIGSSFSGLVEPIPGGKVERVEATTRVAGRWYMLRHHVVPGSGNTEDYIKGFESGTFRKLSIGFGGPDMRLICDQDGREMWESPHYPGEILPNGRTVLFTVFGARLYETSAVYANSTPGALISRWQDLIADGRIAAKDAERLGRIAHHRFALPAFRSYPATRPLDDGDGLIFQGGRESSTPRTETLPPPPDGLTWHRAGESGHSHGYDPDFSKADPDTDNGNEGLIFSR